MPGIVVGIDVSEFNKKLSAAQQAVNGLSSVLKVVPRDTSAASTGLRTMGESSRRAGADISASMDGAKKSLLTTETVINRLKNTLGTLGVGISIKQTISDFSAYQSALTDMGKVTDESFSLIDQKIRSISPELGSATQLMQGYYQTISAGVTEPAKAMDMLKTAAMAAKAAGVSQAETITALTKLMAGYSGAIRSAADASDLLFAIEKQGQTSVGQLVPYIGDLAAISNQAGVSVSEMGATFAALTQTAGGTAQAATQYRAILVGILNPQERLRDLLKEMGYESGVALVKQKGLSQALMMISAQAKKAGLGIGQVISSTEAISGLGPLLQTNFKQVLTNLEEMEKRTGATFNAFGRYTETINGQLDTLQNSLRNVSIAIGESFGSATVSALKVANEGVQAVTENLDLLKSAAVAAASGLVAVMAARKIENIAPAVQQEIKGLRDYKTELIETAKRELEEVKTHQKQYEAWLKTAEAQRRYTKSAAVRNSIDADYLLIQKEVAAGEVKLATATNMSAAAATRAGLAAKSLELLRKGWGGLTSLLGGPWGVALTAATTAITYLSTRQSEGEEIAKRYADVQGTVSKYLKETGDAADGAAGKINNLNLIQATDRLKQAQKDITSTLGSIFMLAGTARESEEGDPLRPFRESLLKLEHQIQTGKVDFENFSNEIQRIGAETGETGLARKILLLASNLENAQLTQAKMNEVLQQGGVAAGNTAVSFDDLVSAMTLFTQAIPGVTGGMNGIILDVKKLDEAVGNSRYALWLANLGKDQKAAAAALKSIGIEQAQAQKFLQGNFEGVKPEQREKIEELIRNNQKAASLTSATKGASKTATAQEGIKKLREEIDRLNGTSVQAVTSLDQKLREIEKTGKEAGLSAQGIADLRNEYQDAFKANTLKDFNKEILQLQGNTSALREIEIGDTVKEWGQKLTAAGLESDEVTAKTEELKAALEKQWNTKNLQVTADFYKQLAEYSGDFNLSMEYQNRLIEIQGQNWIQNGIAMNDVIKMQELMRQEAARDPWSGMLRGMRKWSGEATNLGKQVETSLTSAFDNASDALADFVTTGKLNFADLANSIISDLARIAARQAIGGIVGGLASGLGNLFGGGGGFSLSSGQSSWISNAIGVGAGVASAKGNVFSGGNISDYSNSIVSRPTLFSYGSQLQPFARGAGLMGEAGREAILPLARTSGGNLGVYATFEQRQLQRDMDSLKASMNTVEAIILSHKAQREAAAGPAPEVKVNIINNSNAQVTQETRTDNYGNKTIDVMVGDAAARQLNRPGTTLNKSFYQQTGLQRRAIRR
ncbi:phage tail tape measure protein [uncultured Desulfovibrio sp.]|uniref:phage tail tape measure protein n=1 Tax=uncultured Desulfovibrio sp. TaxID=167968 RepID=UPI0026DB6C34|nr:phage tail tape measure protein [uncultured Desulfovibrio sp.]